MPTVFETVELELARESTRDFSDEVMHRHAEAMTCREVEDSLKKGILAYRWLAQAEETMRAADARGIITLTDELQAAIETLYLAWLTVYGYAERLIQEQLELGFSVDNTAEIGECADRVRGWVEQSEWRKRSRQSRVNRFATEPW